MKRPSLSPRVNSGTDGALGSPTLVEASGLTSSGLLLGSAGAAAANAEMNSRQAEQTSACSSMRCTSSVGRLPARSDAAVSSSMQSSAIFC